jgi:hypothetical protein
VSAAHVHGDDFGWAEAALAAHGAAYLAATGRDDPEALAQRLDWLRAQAV